MKKFSNLFSLSIGDIPVTKDQLITTLSKLNDLKYLYHAATNDKEEKIYEDAVAEVNKSRAANKRILLFKD